MEPGGLKILLRTNATKNLDLPRGGVGTQDAG